MSGREDRRERDQDEHDKRRQRHARCGEFRDEAAEWGFLTAGARRPWGRPPAREGGAAEAVDYNYSPSPCGRGLGQRSPLTPSSPDRTRGSSTV